MTTPSKNKFSFNSIKEFMSSFTGSNPDWGSDPDAELNADFMDEVPDSADVIFTEPVEYSLDAAKEFDLPLGINRAKGEVATAKMVRDQEAFRLRTVHESADIAWQIISAAILQGVGPNLMKVANPREGDYKAEQIPETIHDVIDSMIHVLRDELIDALYDYSEAINDIDIAEWVLSREKDDEDHFQHAVNRICGLDDFDDTVYCDNDLDPIDFDEGFSDYEWLDSIQCLETNDEVIK